MIRKNSRYILHFQGEIVIDVTLLLSGKLNLLSNPNFETTIRVAFIAAYKS